jgi:hypothetical protein
MDYIIALRYDYCAYWFVYNQRITKLEIIEDWDVENEMQKQADALLSEEELEAVELRREEIAEFGDDDKEETNWAEDLGLDKEGKNIMMDDKYASAFAPLFEELINSENRILIFDFSFPMAQMISQCVEQLEKAHPFLHFHCVAFFHNDADTALMSRFLTPKQCVRWRDWYKNGINHLFPLFHFVEIPYQFEINDDYLWGLVDKENPHLPDSRKRRKWLGNAQKRYERGAAAGAEGTDERIERRKAEIEEARQKEKEQAKKKEMPSEEAPHVN